jgi:2-amino-4-hydroxy-6-hydroxymethyldihydropteridine diphosphokinase
MDPDPPPARSPEPACVALGSNLGDRGAHLAAAIEALRATAGIRGLVCSSVYETDPVGPPPQGPYLNAAVRFETTLAPRSLLDRLLEIERARGRPRAHAHHGARSLDLDLLLYGDRRIEEPGLTVPHPRLHRRAFVLEPLCEIAAEWRHPLRGETVATLAERVRDPEAVRRLQGAAAEIASDKSTVCK